MTDLFLSFISNHWRKFLFPFIAIAAILAFMFIPRGQVENETILLSEQISFQENLVEDVEIEEIEESSPAILIVDVQGAVTYPGVYTLDEGDRLIHAIDAAGGYIADADTRQVNHALKLVDEMLIYIPLKGELPIEESTIVSDIGSSGSTSTNDSGGKVNINTATESELTTLAGIGPSKAAAIIQHREEQGPFQTTEALTGVSGIGQKTFEKLQENITVK